MGALAKIEHDKNASAAFTGCAPLDWVLKKAKDFAGWAAKGAFNFIGSFTGDIGYFLKGLGETVGDAWNWVTGIPGIKQVGEAAKGAGAFIATGLKNAAGCIKTTLAGLAIAGTVGLIGGGIYLAVTGGQLATVAAALTLGVLARFSIRSFVQAWQFNWNITDAEIANRYKASVNAIAAQAGSVVGSGLAAIACGGGGAALVLKVNPKAIALVQEVLGEAFDEWRGNAAALVRTTWAATEQWFKLELYRNARSAIKKAAQNPAIAKFLPEQMQKSIQYWGSPGSKPWSFASAIEDATEKIPHEWLKSFLEEAREEFADVCTESTYALSYGL